MSTFFVIRPDSHSPLARKIEAQAGQRKTAPLWSVTASREALRRRYARQARKALLASRKGQTKRAWIARRLALRREATA